MRGTSCWGLRALPRQGLRRHALRLRRHRAARHDRRTCRAGSAASTLVDESIGEGLGKLYVAKYFPPAQQGAHGEAGRQPARPYRRSIDTLDWMGPATRKEALAKLATFTPKIGYPTKWIDYAR
jgi:predicted metalloendopeptidase